ncbi:MAG: Nodulin-like-domain-containing protein [Monoraphidium minutum]|nr:MAG: Nodulin-like-domain-containing protein [Monoraphidium minutum]
MAPQQPHPRKRVRVSKWVTFAASCIIQTCAGLSYSFSLYGPALKERMGLTQVEIATIGSAVNFGGYFAIVSGAVYDAVKGHHKIGPRLVMAMGSVCCVCGYLGLWMLASGRASGGMAELLLLAAVAGNAGTWYDTAALVTNVRNFPNSRGFVVGILKSFLGLSASVYATLYAATLAPDAITFLLVIALAPPLVNTLMSSLVNYVPWVEASETAGRRGQGGVSSERRFLLTYYLVGATAAYQCAAALAISAADPPRAVRGALAAGCLCLLALVGLVPRGAGGWWAEYDHEHTSADDAPTADDAFPCADDDGGAASGAGALHAAPERAPLLSPERGPENSAPQPPPPQAQLPPELPSLSTAGMVATFEFYCVFAQFCVGTGAGLALLNNAGQLFVALGGAPGGHVVLVSLFSVANATGRLVMGYLPEAALHSRGTPRPLFLVAVAAGMSLASLAAAYSGLAALYPVTVVMGLLFGSHWSLVPAITSDLFGLANFGSNYCFLQFAPAAGSYLLATRLAGRLYDAAAAAHGDPRECIGPDCFRAAFLILSAMAALSALGCGACAVRSRGAYRLIVKHLKQVEESEQQLSA